MRSFLFIVELLLYWHYEDYLYQGKTEELVSRNINNPTNTMTLHSPGRSFVSTMASKNKPMVNCVMNFPQVGIHGVDEKMLPVQEIGM